MIRNLSGKIARLALAAILLAPVVRVAADCGSVPFYAPRMVDLEFASAGDPLISLGKALDALREANKAAFSGKKVLDFDPLNISVFEPKQRALILWNGDEEILLLSTDQRATQVSAVLEVIPLPAEPQVRLGSFETFEKAQKLMIEKRMWACAHGGARAELFRQPLEAGRITFHQKMGAHEVTVAQVIDQNGFVDFVQKHLRETYKTPEAPIRPDFVKIIDSYLQEGYRWFAFDVIALGGDVQSRQPIEYRFQSDCVFYPMRISSLEKGKTEVELLVFSPGGLTRFEGLAREHFGVEPRVECAPGEVEGLDEKWQGFFGERAKLAMDQWFIRGELETFVSDVKVR